MHLSHKPSLRNGTIGMNSGRKLSLGSLRPRTTRNKSGSALPRDRLPSCHPLLKPLLSHLWWVFGAGSSLAFSRCLAIIFLNGTQLHRRLFHVASRIMTDRQGSPSWEVASANCAASIGPRITELTKIIFGSAAYRRGPLVPSSILGIEKIKA